MRALARHVPLAAALPAILLLLPSCGAFGALGDYGDNLVDPRTGRSPVVTWPAKFGFGAGFLAGLPLCLVGSPVTYPVHRLTSEPEESYLFSFLRPSLVAGVAGTIIFGTPFDLLEFGLYRSWSGGEGEMPRPEREEEERPGEGPVPKETG